MWDVTVLVQAWVDGDYHPRGFHLRAVGGDGTYNFYAREHLVGSERPVLLRFDLSGLELSMEDEPAKLDD